MSHHLTLKRARRVSHSEISLATDASDRIKLSDRHRTQVSATRKRNAAAPSATALGPGCPIQAASTTEKSPTQGL